MVVFEGDVIKTIKKLVSQGSRRYLRTATLQNMDPRTSRAVDIYGYGLQYLEVIQVDLQLPRLAGQFHGKRIVHISDLHCSRTVSTKYLRYCIDRINRLDADIVVLTGDYVTHDIYGRFRKKMIDLVADIRSRLGIYACLGNHDYGIGGVFGSLREHQLRRMINDMTNCGIKVLRNGSSVLQIDGESLWFVGLGDLWADDFEPEKAFADVDANGPVITLAHNPDSIKHLKQFDFDAVMCGHTHGIPVQFVTSFGWPVLNRYDYHAGLYRLGNKKLYVNRGLGRFGRTLFNTRPEITIFNLR